MAKPNGKAQWQSPMAKPNGKAQWQSPLVSLAGMAALLACIAPDAQAQHGHWDITINAVGQKEETKEISSVWTIVEAPIQHIGTATEDNYANPSWQHYAHSSSVNQGRTGLATMQVEVMLKLEWHHIQSSACYYYGCVPTPPDKVSLLVDSVASAQWNYSKNLQGIAQTGEAIAANGLGHPSVLTVSDSSVSYYETSFSSGKRILSKDNATRADELTIGPLRMSVDTFVTGNTPTSSDTSGCGTSFLISAKVDNHYLILTSNREPSYRKVENDADLPRRRDMYGTLIVNNFKLRDTTPYSGPSSGPWAVLCERNGVDPLEVHSTAMWNTDPSAFSPSWRGRADFQANDSGFFWPEFYWTKPSTMVSGESSDKRVLRADGYALFDSLGGAFTSDDPVGIRYVNMHPDLSATGAATSTGVSVNVVETYPYSPAIDMTDSYSINWHLPVENWRKLENQSVELPPEKFDLRTAGGALSAKPNTTMVYGDRSFLRDLSVGPALETTGTVLGAGAGVYALVVGVGLNAGPAGWLALAAAVTGAGGIAVSALPDPPQEIALQSATSYNAYKAAVTQGGNYEDGTPCFAPSEAIPYAIRDFKDAEVYNDDNPDNNDHFMDAWVHMSGQVIFFVWDDKWIGDAYDSNGYKGNEHGRNIRRIGPNYKVNFRAPAWTPPADEPPGD